MGWIEFESLWLFCPFFDDEFVRGKAFEQREAIALIICVDEIGEMSFELLMPIVMVVFDGGFLDRPVHSLHLAICPRMLELGQTMHNAIFLASHVEQVRHVGGCRPIRVARREGELDAIVRFGFYREGPNQGFQESGRRCSAGLFHQLHKGKFARAINGDIEIELPFSGLHLGDVDVKVADRIGLELAFLGLVPFHIRQAADSVSLQAAMQGLASQMAVPFYNCIARMQWRPEPMHGAQVAAATNVLFD
jgi:hypothetical protein